MTKTEFDVMREALGQYTENQADFVDSLSDNPESEEYKKEAAKLAVAEQMLEKLELNITGLA